VIGRRDVTGHAALFITEHRHPTKQSSRRQTIDKVGQLLWAWFSFQRQSLNHDTRHLSRHESDDKKMADDEDADAFMLLYFLTAKQHKKRTVWVRRWLLDR